MENEKISQTDRIRAYNRLIEKQAGRAVRPYRADGYVNLLNRYGTSKDATEHYQFQVEPTIPDDVLTAFYEGNGLFAKIIDTPAEEAIKHGFSIDDLTDQKTIDFYTEALDELDWDETAMTAIKWARLFGGSIVVMLINDGRGIDEPLDWSAIESIDDLRVYDRSLITPDTTGMFSYTADDPFRTRSSRLGMPEYYMVHSQYGNFTVHESRCLVFTNGVLPENTTNSEYRMWGIPEYIRLQRAIRDTELAHRCAPKMLDRSVQAVYKMKGLADLLSTTEGEDNVLKRLQTIDMARGMLSSITIDSEGEDYDFRQFQFSGVSEVIDSTCNFLSALTSIPQTILFGRSPAGMNSTGVGDMENYYNFVERIQTRTLRSNLRYLLSVLFQAGLATGEIDEMPKIKVKFNPLWSMSETEQADLDLKKSQIQQAKATTAQIYVNMQCVDPSEVRKGLASSDEFDIDNLLDEDIDTDDELFEELAESEDSPDEGNSSEAAPAATKLPQDMTDKDLAQKAIEGSENVDSEAALATVTPEGENICSVGVVVVSDGKILCGARHNDFGYGLVCGPGGHIENGETPEQAAFRETEEEFGISPTELIPLGLGPKEPDTGLTPMIFLCTEFNGTPECLDLEMVNPQFRTLEEIEELSSLLFQPFKDGINLMLKSLDDSVDTDGGPGSGNHGHEGVEGEIGGSAPSGSDVGGKKHQPISKRTKPSVKSPKSFDDYVKENGLTPIYRGYSAETESELEEYRDSYKNGTVPESGEKSSALGKGVYFSISSSEAEGYMSRRQGERGHTKGRVTTAALDVDAQIADYNDMKNKKLEDEHNFIQKAFEAKAKGDTEEYDRMRNAYYEIQEMAFEDYVRSQGYHAISEPALGYVVVLDQKALVVRDDSICSNISENIIDKSAKISKIKSKEYDDQDGPGAPIGNDNAAKGHRTKATAQEKSSFRKKLKGTTTVTGATVEKVHTHACDRMIERGVSPETVKNVLETAPVTYPGNRQGRTCYQKDNYRIVVSDTDKMVLSVVDLEED